MSDFANSTNDQRHVTVRYLHAIRQHWKLVLLFVVGALAVSVFYLARTPKQYEASADIAVAPVSANDDTFQGFSLFRQSLDQSSSVVTAARLFRSPEIRQPVQHQLGSSWGDVSFQVDPLAQADIVTITATAPSPELAARAANVFAATAVAARTSLFQSELLAQVARLRKRVDAVPAAQREGNFEFAAIAQRLGLLQAFVGAPDPTLRIAARATEPEGPSWPRPKLTVAAALFAALLIGCAIAVALEVANPRVSREEELQLEQRLPILARVPRLTSRTAHGYLVGKEQLPSQAWKGYRTLRAVLANAGADGRFPRSILVTSATPGDGKTMTAVNLAITLAASDMSVVLIDADLHRPMIASIFHVPLMNSGFTGALSGREPVGRALTPAPSHPRLSLLLSKREHQAQVNLLESERLTALLDQLKERVDVVVIDSPPVPEVAEALGLAAAADAVIVSVRLGHTRRDKLNQLREMLARRGVSPIGLVVTTRSRSEPEGAYDYASDIATTPSTDLAAQRPVTETGEPQPRARVVRL